MIVKNYANLCMIIHARDIIFFRSLYLILMRVYVEVQGNVIGSFRGKVERQTDIENYKKD